MNFISKTECIWSGVWGQKLHSAQGQLSCQLGQHIQCWNYEEGELICADIMSSGK